MQITVTISCANRNALQMHLKSVGYTDTVLFSTIGNAVNVARYRKAGYLSQKRLGKSAANLGNFWSPKLLPTYLIFYADRYLAYQ